MSVLTQDNVVVLIFGVSVLLFYAAKRILEAIYTGAIEALKSKTLSMNDSYRLSRYTAGYLVLLFVSTLVKVAAGLALALGVLKTVSDIAGLFLPPKMLGLALLIGYCALAPIFDVVKDDIVKMFTKFVEPP